MLEGNGAGILRAACQLFAVRLGKAELFVMSELERLTLISDGQITNILHVRYQPI